MRGCGEWVFHRYSLTFLTDTISRRELGPFLLCAPEIGLQRVSDAVCLILLHQRL